MLHSDVQPGDFSVCALWKQQGPGKPGPCWFLGVEQEIWIGDSGSVKVGIQAFRLRYPAAAGAAVDCGSGVSREAGGAEALGSWVV